MLSELASAMSLAQKNSSQAFKDHHPHRVPPHNTFYVFTSFSLTMSVVSALVWGWMGYQIAWKVVWRITSHWTDGRSVIEGLKWV